MQSRRTWLNVTREPYYFECQAGAEAAECPEHRQSKGQDHDDVADGPESVVGQRCDQVEATEVQK
jgi:hypothetical protein